MQIQRVIQSLEIDLNMRCVHGLSPMPFRTVPVSAHIGSRAIVLPRPHKYSHDRRITAAARPYATHLLSFDLAFTVLCELNGRLLGHR